LQAGLLVPARIEEEGRPRRKTVTQPGRLQVSWSFSMDDKLWEGLARWTIESVVSVVSSELDMWA
jgi:hypothetical protein